MNQRIAIRIREAMPFFYKPLYFSYLLFADYRSWRFFPDWLASFRKGRSPLDDGVPWLPFWATRWLQSYLRPDMRVFEYGSGGSTVFFAQSVRQVFAVEHDRTWHHAVTATLAQRGLINASCRLCEPQSMDGMSSATDAPKASAFVPDEREWEYPGLSFDTYAKAIDAHPDHTFDLVLVDGRARAACIHRALRKVRQRGYLMLDNSSDPGLGQCLEIMKPYPRTDFYGIAPYWPPGRWGTSVWAMSQ